MITVVSRVVGADTAAFKLQRIAMRMLDFSPAFDDIGDFYRNQVRAQFDAAPWQPLAPLTIKLRRGFSARGGAKPLNASGALKASWTIPGGALGNINRVRPMTAKFGSAHTKQNNAGQVKGIAALHQSGTPGGMVPARPVMLVTPPLEAAIVSEFINHLFG